MSANLNCIYSIKSNSMIDINTLTDVQYYSNLIVCTNNNSQNIVNTIKAFEKQTSVSVQKEEVKKETEKNINDDIINEALRLKRHSKLTTLNELKEEVKYALIISTSGRLMVDGDLFNGVIKTDLNNTVKYVEFKLGRPVAVLIESKKVSENNKTVLKLTKYEYSNSNSNVTKTEKTLSYENNSYNVSKPRKERFAMSAFEMQMITGISNKDNLIK